MIAPLIRDQMYRPKPIGSKGKGVDGFVWVLVLHTDRVCT